MKNDDDENLTFKKNFVIGGNANANCGAGGGLIYKESTFAEARAAYAQQQHQQRRNQHSGKIEKRFHFASSFGLEATTKPTLATTTTAARRYNRHTSIETSAAAAAAASSSSSSSISSANGNFIFQSGKH